MNLEGKLKVVQNGKGDAVLVVFPNREVGSCGIRNASAVGMPKHAHVDMVRGGCSPVSEAGKPS